MDLRVFEGNDISQRHGAALRCPLFLLYSTSPEAEIYHQTFVSLLRFGKKMDSLCISVNQAPLRSPKFQRIMQP